MTKQQKTYFLLLITLIVWGIIGYQIYNRFNPKQEVLLVSKTDTYEPKQLINSIPYTIKANYRDPFLGKFPSKKSVVKKKKKTIKKDNNTPFPRVIYNGIVEGNSKSFIITVNGNQESFKLKETLHKVTLLKGNATAITLRFNGETKIFTQQ